MLSALLPWAGLQLVAYVGVLGLIAAIVLQTERKFLVCVACGIAAGGVALALFYIRAGTLTAFVASALPHTALGWSEHIGMLAAARELITTDYGTLFLFPLVVIAAIMVLFKSTNNRKTLIFLILVCMIVPVALLSIGKFPIYYFWMTFIPISAIAVLVLDQFMVRRVYSLIVGSFICVSILIGLPTRIAVAMLDRDGRDYTKVEAYVKSVMTSRDIAFVDFAAYYPAKMEATRIYLEPYLKVISESERKSVTIAILHRRETDPMSFLSTEFGGEWFSPAPDYPAERHQTPGRGRCVYFSSTLSLPRFILLTSPYSIWPPRCDFMVFRRKG